MLNWLKKVLGIDGASLSAGGLGERQAAAWLERERGFVVVARNWRSPRDRRDEIDLVCRDGEVLVFVEVKARSSRALVPGVHAVDARKKRVLRRTALAYLAGLAEKPLTFRLDIVEVVLDGGQESHGSRADAGLVPGNGILHFENVPLFPKHFRG
jgi:putative endonuclease